MRARKPTQNPQRWPTIPSWASALLAALLAFMSTWGALQMTVSSLQGEVATLKSLVQTVAVLDATSKTHEAEIARMREGLEMEKQYRSRILERISALEAKRR